MKKKILRAAAALFLSAAVLGGDGTAPAVAAERALPHVEIYTTSWCGYCKQAVGYLQSRRIPFTEYDIEKDEAAQRRWKEIAPEGGVPVAVIGKRTVRGYSREIYEKLLSEGGRQ